MRLQITHFAMALCGVACLTNCGSNTVGGSAIDGAWAPLIPSDTKVLAEIKIDKLKSTPLYQRHEKDLQFPMLDGSSERLGLDPRRDVSDVVVAWDGKQALFLIQGTFKRRDVEQKLAGLGGGRSMYKDHAVLESDRNAVAFIRDGLAVASSRQLVRKTIDLADSTDSTVPEELKSLLEQVPAGDQLWIVSRSGLPFADAPMRSDYTSALSNIVNYVSGARVGVKADSGAHVRMDITCISDQGAQRVHDALRGGIGLARLSTKDDQRELLQVYDAINVDQDKATVHVNADYSGELADKLFQELGPMMGGQRH